MQLPYLSSPADRVGGELKTDPTDFRVDEIPAYEPSGTGDHLYLKIQKTDVSAEQLLTHLADTLKVRRDDIGMAGLKDRRAVTTQWISVPAKYQRRLPAVEAPGIVVLDTSRHHNKLRTGHLRGNRFQVVVRDVEADALEAAHRIHADISRHGFPNYYGDQRFGHDGETLDLGLDLLRQIRVPHQLPKPRRRFLVRLSLSAVQSHLFNTVLAERMQRALLEMVLEGDVLQKVTSGGCFVCTEPEIDQPRFDRHDIVPTGPMFGPKMLSPTGLPAELEAAALEACDLTAEQFAEFRKWTPGTRRPLLIVARDFEVSADPETPNELTFRFTLPPGVYATTLMREFLKPADSGETEPASS